MVDPMTPDLKAKLDAFEKRLKAIESNVKLMVAQVQRLGEQVGLLVQAQTKNGG